MDAPEALVKSRLEVSDKSPPVAMLPRLVNAPVCASNDKIPLGLAVLMLPELVILPWATTPRLPAADAVDSVPNQTK